MTNVFTRNAFSKADAGGPAPSIKIQPINRHRRAFLKYLGFAAGGFAVSRLLSDRSGSAVTFDQGSDLKRFSVKEQSGSLIFSNAQGRQLFQLHQDGELEIG